MKKLPVNETRVDKVLKENDLQVNSQNIKYVVDLTDKESCRRFLNNLYIENKRVEFIQLANGEQIRMEDIPEDQWIQRASEIYHVIEGNVQ
jgi:hypothetical protein